MDKQPIDEFGGGVEMVVLVIGVEEDVRLVVEGEIEEEALVD